MPNLNYTTLFIVAQQDELQLFAPTLDLLDMEIRTASVDVPKSGVLCNNMVLCNFSLHTDPTKRYKVEYIVQACQASSIPILFYTTSQTQVPQSKGVPVVCIHNRELFVDYIRIKALENQNFVNADDFTKALLKKDVERENLQKKLDSLKTLFTSIPKSLNEKVLILSRYGNIIEYSKGFMNFFTHASVRRSEVADGLHPNDLLKISNNLKAFIKQEKDTASFWARHNMGTSVYHRFKVHMTNFFNTSQVDFAILTIENEQKPTINDESKQAGNWLSAFFGRTLFDEEKNSDDNNTFPFQKLHAIFPQVLNTQRFIVLSISGEDTPKLRQWSNNSESTLTPEELQVAEEFVSPTSIHFLEKHSYKRHSVEEFSHGENKNISFVSLLDLLYIKNFISVPFPFSRQKKYIFLVDINPETPYTKDVTPPSVPLSVSSFDFINFLPIPISIKDRKHRWVATNEAMLKFLQKNKEDVLGLTDYELFREEEANVFWETDELVLEEKINFQNEEYIYTSSDEPRIVVTNKSIFTIEDGNEFLVSTMKDVTELKKIEKNLRERTEKLRKSERKLKSLNSTKDRFFSIIAHDLKNPFNTLVGFSGILAEDLDQFEKSEIEEFITIISDAAQNGYKLLENLLDWARTQTGKFQFSPSTINVQFLIEECISLLRSSAEQKNIMLHNQVTSALHAYADANMVELIIRNLVSNAIKFTEFGGKVRIEATDVGSFIEISIIDNGIGIRQDDIDKLFRIDVEFSQVGTDSETGTGLGLILCKEFVDKNGGHIYVESTHLQGSTFSFKIPKTNPSLESSK